MRLAALTERAENLIAKYDTKRAAILPVLHIAQESLGWVSPEAEEWAGQLIGISLAHVREVVSFYTLFNRQPIGKYHIQVCGNMSCDLLGSSSVVDYLKEKLEIQPGGTTADGKFTLSTVECLGACEAGPMMQINDHYYGPLTPQRIDEILDGLE
ncbi:MAG: NADH-quinone oxidoreductase subunit NuoE [Candidatus Omnitrophica bacterium]|nr:NADH-quinone oxidoreductase subunit NuoE [Candidatus Omnitrophota bacterium]